MALTPLAPASHDLMDRACARHSQGIAGAVVEKTDVDGYRTEILCAKCGGHLGHVFKNEGFRNPTNERHCVNSVSIDFKRAE